MKNSAGQTSIKATDITEAHHWRPNRILRNKSVSLCWPVEHNKTLAAADDAAPRCAVCVAMERELRR